MRKSVSLSLLIILVSCSPYKKVTVSASEYMTNNMKGSTHADVIKSLGTYTKRTDVEGGYKLLFDYSFTLNDGASKTQTYQKQNSVRPTTPRLDPKQMNIDPRSSSEKQPGMAQFGDTKMAKFLEVSFTNEGLVQSVRAEGFSDSVKYVPRK
jgi:hypothetical protein